MCELTTEMLAADTECQYRPSTEAERSSCEDWRNLHREIEWRERLREYERNQILLLIYKASGIAAIMVGMAGLWWIA